MPCSHYSSDEIAEMKANDMKARLLRLEAAMCGLLRELEFSKSIRLDMIHNGDLRHWWESHQADPRHRS